MVRRAETEEIESGHSVENVNSQVEDTTEVLSIDSTSVLNEIDTRNSKEHEDSESQPLIKLKDEAPRLTLIQKILYGIPQLSCQFGNSLINVLLFINLIFFFFEKNKSKNQNII